MTTTHTERPEYMPVLAAARAQKASTNETIIIYVDLDTDAELIEYCSESTFDRMQDNGQVESTWIIGIV